MKKKKKTYVLLGVVLVVWGILGFKVIGTLGSNTEVALVASTPKVMPVSEKTTRDTFSIAANYRDPFLGTLPKSNRPDKKKIKAIKKPQLPKRNISYAGSIGNNGTKKRMFFVTIDGKEHIMSKNDKIDGVTLLWGNTESIKVKYPGYSQIIKLQ